MSAELGVTRPSVEGAFSARPQIGDQGTPKPFRARRPFPTLEPTDHGCHTHKFCIRKGAEQKGLPEQRRNSGMELGYCLATFKGYRKLKKTPGVSFFQTGISEWTNNVE
jgi:hypothetical protein